MLNILFIYCSFFSTSYPTREGITHASSKSLFLFCFFNFWIFPKFNLLPIIWPCASSENREAIQLHPLKKLPMQHHRTVLTTHSDNSTLLHIYPLLHPWAHRRQYATLLHRQYWLFCSFGSLLMNRKKSLSYITEIRNFSQPGIGTGEFYLI